jgi:cardiolipin synthase
MFEAHPSGASRQRKPNRGMIMRTSRGDKKNHERHEAFYYVLTIALVLFFITGCAGSKQIEFTEAFDEEAISAHISVAGPIDISGGNRRSAMRRTAALAQAGVLLTRSFRVDPVNRPISNVLSLSSYVLKSTGGLLRRVALGSTQFPSLEATAIPEVTYEDGMDLEQWEKDLDKISGTKSSKGTISFLVDGEEYFNRLLDAVDTAAESIDIRTYIFDNDDFAVAVADKLKNKSKDVDIRVLVDGLGNMLAMQSDSITMPTDFKVPLSMERYIEQDSEIRVRTNSNPWLTGDHTKTTIIDKKLAFVGGMNIGREYRYEWHDIMMEVSGPIVDKLQYDTNKAWAKASFLGDVANFFAFLRGKKANADDAGYPVRALYTRNFNSQIYRAQIEAIRRARRYILIENAYFSDDSILYELAKARRRGVDVRVILPDAGNHGALHASNQVAINRMLRNGIRVYLFPGMSHVKAAVIDGWACVGSANFDKLSLKINKELNLSTSYEPAVNELLDRVFIPDLARSTEIDQQVNVTLQARLLEVLVDEAL